MPEINEVAANTTILNLERGRVTNRRKVDNSNVETEIDKKMLHVDVDLFDAPELKACQTFLNALNSRVMHYVVPSFFRGGMYLVKNEAITKVDDILTKAAEDFRPIVKKFSAVVDQRKEESRARLGAAFDSRRYPTAAEVEATFRIEWNWIAITTPDGLSTIDSKIYERERKKAEANLQEMVAGVTQLLAAEAKGLGDHLMERLTPGPDGKKKIFRDSAVTNITEFLSTFNLRNIGNNAELEKQVKRIHWLLKGIDPESLRDNAKLREDVIKGFEAVTAELDTLVIAKPTRFIDMKELTA
jgi:hypothetical protein